MNECRYHGYSGPTLIGIALVLLIIPRACPVSDPGLTRTTILIESRLDALQQITMQNHTLITNRLAAECDSIRRLIPASDPIEYYDSNGNRVVILPLDEGTTMSLKYFHDPMPLR